MLSSVGKDLARRVFVATCRARTAAIHLGYTAYQMSLWRPVSSTKKAATGLQRRLAALFKEDCADAMRRRLIPPVVRYTRSNGHSRQRPFKILDIACGTGHLLRMLGAALPDAQLVGVDLSPHYMARARALLPRELNVSLLAENAESLPFVGDHFDAATCVFLLHELPPEVRERVIAEMARVVRPGGIVVLADSLQLHDAPELERELLAFPENFHEPYYLSYLRDDIAARMGAAGLRVLDDKAHFLMKVVVAVKPA